MHGAGVRSLSWIFSATKRFPSTCLWCLSNVYFSLVLWTIYVLIFPKIAKRDFSCQIWHFLYREHFWNAFQAMETPCHPRVLWKDEAGRFYLWHSDRRCQRGKAVRVPFLSQEALGMQSVDRGECTEQLVACNLLISGVVLRAMLPCLYKLALCCFPHLCKQGMVMTHLSSLESGTRLKCISGTGNYQHQTRAPRLRGTTLVSVP